MRHPRLRTTFGALVVLGLAAAAGADRIDDLARALKQDASYKVRVQAALVLGKLADRRAVPALIDALRDDNESVRGVAATSLGRIGDRSAADALQAAGNDPSPFVASQARHALELIASASPSLPIAGQRSGARYYLSVGFQGSTAVKVSPQLNQALREALARELQKLPAVTLSVGGEATASVLSQKKLRGYVVDGSIQRLSASKVGGQQQIDCDLKAFVATYPDKSIKMMTTEGASLTANGDPESAKRECLLAAVEGVREDVGKFLKTLE